MIGTANRAKGLPCIASELFLGTRMKLDQALAKVFKFVTFVFFTFMALCYFGILILLPLDVLFQVIRVIHAIGMPTVVAATIGISLLVYLGLAVSKMPQLCELIVDIGKQLIEFGHSQIKRCDQLVTSTGEGSA